MRAGRSRMCILLAAWHAVSGVSPVIITSCDAFTWPVGDCPSHVHLLRATHQQKKPRMRADPHISPLSPEA